MKKIFLVKSCALIVMCCVISVIAMDHLRFQYTKEIKSIQKRLDDLERQLYLEQQWANAGPNSQKQNNNAQIKHSNNNASNSNQQLK
jgi:hypothetical protein